MIRKEGCTCLAPQTVPDMSTPASQQDMQLTDTQVHELLLRQQHIRVLLESCPDEADIDPLVHTNITKQNKTPTTSVVMFLLLIVFFHYRVVFIVFFKQHITITIFQGKHGDGGQNMSTNTNVTPKATPHMEPDAPIFDVTPQIKV